MTKKLYISLIFSNLMMYKALSAIIFYMHNFTTNFYRIIDICEEFARNRVNHLSNVPRSGVVPMSSDLEVIALGINGGSLSFCYRHDFHAIRISSIIDLSDRSSMR